MARKVFNHMEYQEGMDVIESDIMDTILNLTSKYDYNTYTKDDVLKALSKDILNLEDFGALLSPVATNMLEPMAQRSKKETAKHFGNTVTMFTPLYIANYCENECVYCGLNCKNRIKRGMLSLEQIDIEMKNIADTGLRDILLLTGECRHMSDVEYIGEAVKIAKKYFTSISIEVYPLNIDEYKYLQECGADFVCVYQETYDPIRYEQVHLSGFKRCYPYRVNAHERALLGGMRGVSFGALLGLSDFRKDAFSAGVHAMLIQKKYPHAEISFSFPRLRPYKNNAENNSNDVHEKQLLQIMLAYRIFMPYAGITISTRERDGFRDNVIGLCATKISAGVKVSVGGHGEEAQGDEQFEISDPRSVDEVYNSVLNHGLQPVFTDYIRTN
ncbi:MAG: 2-iminoacetate synthase ThiH [Ruminococcus sp.]|nr:2-iminoacetate synthase ThiH [Ruminococcus sp.]